MMWAIISRTGDILQLIGLGTVVACVAFGTWRVSRLFKR